MRLCARLLVRGVPKPSTSAFLDRDYGFTRTMPKAYLDKMKNLIPHKIYDNRFGAPPVKYWMRNTKHRVEDYVETDHYAFEDKAVEANRHADMKRTRAFSKYRGGGVFDHPDYPAVEPMEDKQWVFFVGDKVEIMVGKDKGRFGKICDVLRQRNSVKVAHMHTKRSLIKGDNLASMDRWTDEEQWLRADKDEVKIVHPLTNRGCDVVWYYSAKSDVFERGVVDRQGNFTPVDVPNLARATYEFNEAKSYIEVEDKDTKADDVVKITMIYNPTSSPPQSVEHQLAESNGIDDYDKRAKTYWY